MVIIVVCLVLVGAGLVAAWRWGGRDFVPPDPTVALNEAEFMRRFAWYVSITLVTGIGAGIAIIGAGGRLAMRLLAVTAGDEAQGRITEAQEVVGEITVGGTFGFIVFAGVFGGLLATAPYLLVRRFLPAGRAGGLLYGLALLAVFGATIEPLRRDNPDFDLVGPGWLAVIVFVVMALAFGSTVAGLAARLSTWLPLLKAERRVLARYALPALVAIPAFWLVIFTAVAGVVGCLLTGWLPQLVTAVRSTRWVRGGQVALALVVAVSLPTIVASVADIATR